MADVVRDLKLNLRSPAQSTHHNRLSELRISNALVEAPSQLLRGRVTRLVGDFVKGPGTETRLCPVDTSFLFRFRSSVVRELLRG